MGKGGGWETYVLDDSSMEVFPSPVAIFVLCKEDGCFSEGWAVDLFDTWPTDEFAGDEAFHQVTGERR